MTSPAKAEVAATQAGEALQPIMKFPTRGILRMRTETTAVQVKVHNNVSRISAGVVHIPIHPSVPVPSAVRNTDENLLRKNIWQRYIP